MSTEKPTPSELTALWILMTAKTWGAAIGAIAEGEPQVVEMLAAHDRDIANAAAKKALLDAADSLLVLDCYWKNTHAQEIAEWLRARAESYGGQ